MSAIAFTAPIQAGKEGPWKEFSLSLQAEPRRSEYATFMKSCGLTRIRCWMQHGPQGAAAIILYEGRDPLGFQRQVGTSQEPFAVWFRQQVLELHGMDLSKPLGSPPELVTDVQTG